MDYDALAMQMMSFMRSMSRIMPQRKLNESLQGEAHLLVLLSFADGETQPGEISDATGVSPARVAMTLNSLEAKGYVTRRIDPSDRRKILVSITAEGRKSAEENFKRTKEMFAEMLRLLGEKDAAELVRITGRVAELRAEDFNKIKHCKEGVVE